ncbi:hypothetical protein HO133_010863 [Letharia lupina]|uniref:Uncharacterized protein n=1 Tax=Letharia lupina TaxID=560253 RepID=A0A8H6CIW0_9LECA|nr:uncharacterized protein HO133_010863 [Letharia lupina]KAF6224288.1 hypothetical protein HO133_010863 [Letharia lupina]
MTARAGIRLSICSVIWGRIRTHSPLGFVASNNSPKHRSFRPHYQTQREAGLPTFGFEFRHFIAIYSAWHFLKPETIYIHTNVVDDIVKKEIATAINPYMQAIGKISNLESVHSTPPTNTTTGKTVVALPNMSDFVRTDALVKYGGIFLNEDSYVLRDLKPLRGTGFENFIGRQMNGQICPAVLLSTRDNNFMKAYHALQDVIFDGQCNDVGKPAVNNHPIDNLTDFIENFQLIPPNTWQRDWRLSNTLHGWTSSLLGGTQTLLSTDESKKIFGAFDGINFEYVQAQNSNFARAVYPAVKHALDNGFLDGVKGHVIDQEAPQRGQQKELGGAAAD